MTPPKTTKRSRPPNTKRSASEIAPGVFVGGWKDAERFEGRKICVLDEVPEEGIADATYIPIYDGARDAPIRANLERIVGLVDTARAKDEPVLLFCGYGVRRGSLAGAWYLHRHDGISLDEAYGRVRAVRPQIEEVKKWVGRWDLLYDPEPGRPRSTKP